MVHFKNNYFLTEALSLIPDLLSINDAKRLLRSRKKYALIVGKKLHLTNQPELLFVQKYFFPKLNKATLIILQ